MKNEPSSAPCFAEAVRRVQGGDPERFSDLVRDFQDMAVGYAYSLLGDFQLAEDAAQEAFLDAYRHLGSLREPRAFPGWLRRIVYKHCDRWTRRQTPPTLAFDEAGYKGPSAPSPADDLENRETRDRLLAALDCLSERQRSVVVLHHMGGRSLGELSTFLGVPAATVKKRLHDARTRLREAVPDRLADHLRTRRPSHDAGFARGVVEILDAARHGDTVKVRALLLRNPALRHGRDFMGNTALILAVACGHLELAALLREAGPSIDIHEAAAIGDTPRVVAYLDEHPGLLDAFSAQGFTALGLAAHFGHVGTLRLLLRRGAEVNVVSRHPIGVTPLHAALFGRQVEAAMLLIDHGADVAARRGGKEWPRAGWTPLHYAAAYGLVGVMTRLLARGASPRARDEEGRTPIEVARSMKQEAAARRSSRRSGIKRGSPRRFSLSTG